MQESTYLARLVEKEEFLLATAPGHRVAHHRAEAFVAIVVAAELLQRFQEHRAIRCLGGSVAQCFF